MRRFLIAILVIVSPLILNGQQVLNGGFEDINPNVSNPSDPYPEHWGSFHLTSSSLCWAIPQTGVISTDSHSGEYCIKMETLDCFGDDLQEEGGYSIYHPLTGFPDAISVPYSERPDFFSFYYKFISQGGDSAKANVLLFNYDSITPELTPWERIDTVGYAEQYITETVTEYTQFIAPIEYVSVDFPSFINVIFRTGVDCEIEDCHTGTTLWVDDVDVSGGTLSTVDTEHWSRNISVYPNPTTDAFRIKAENGTEIESITISDYLGREIKTWPEPQDNYPVSELKQGTYFVTVHSEKGQIVKRLIKAN
jgi:hypothetical protein